MEAFYIDKDRKRLYFKNYERRPDDEEFEEVVSILKNNNCEFMKNLMGPDCDIYRYKINDMYFDLVRTIDGDGSFLYCDDINVMHIIEKMFKK